MSSSLYLEQYLDSLEPLPGELRRNFTLMRDLDSKNRAILQEVDAASDEYLRKVRELSAGERKTEMANIQAMFAKAKQNGDDKVSIAVQTYELVDKHIRRLDSDLAKFEAEMKEKGRISQTETEDDDDVVEEDSVAAANKKKKGKNAKTASTSAADKKKAGKKAQTSSAMSVDVAEDKKAGRKKKKSVSVNSAASTASGKGPERSPDGVGGASGGGGGSGGGLLSPGMLSAVPQEVLDMPVDPNEPTYCLCQQVSYGEMIGCDNNDCTIEWFHFGCMGLTTKPKGKWYCPKCIGQFKKKK